MRLSAAEKFLEVAQIIEDELDPAVQLLSGINSAQPAAEAIRRLIGMKDEAQYGLRLISQENQKKALRQAWP